MKATFTPFDYSALIRYLYRETNPEETLIIEQALASDWMLREVFEELAQFHRCLDKFYLKAPEHILKKVLEKAQYQYDDRESLTGRI